MITTAIMVFAGLTIGNYLYQMVTGKSNWSAAFERSFFQGVAILVLVLVILL